MFACLHKDTEMAKASNSLVRLLVALLVCIQLTDARRLQKTDQETCSCVPSWGSVVEDTVTPARSLTLLASTITARVPPLPGAPNPGELSQIIAANISCDNLKAAESGAVTVLDGLDIRGGLTAAVELPGGAAGIVVSQASGSGLPLLRIVTAAGGPSPPSTFTAGSAEAGRGLKSADEAMVSQALDRYQAGSGLTENDLATFATARKFAFTSLFTLDLSDTEIQDLGSSAGLTSLETLDLSDTGLKLKSKKLKKKTNGRKHLLQSGEDAITLVSSDLTVGDNVLLQSTDNISMAAGTSDTANTAVQVAKDAVQFTVSEAATVATGGRRLLGEDERVASKIRVDAVDGVNIKSKEQLKVLAGANIDLAAGTATTITTGDGGAANAVFQVVPEAVQFTVSEAADTGGRKLLSPEERIASMIRIDAAGGIHVKSKKPLKMEAATLDVFGPLKANNDLQVEGSMAAKKGLDVHGGSLAANSGLQIPAGEKNSGMSIGSWTLFEDPATGDLVFKFKDSLRQAVLRNPLRSNACPGSKLAKWCLE